MLVVIKLVSSKSLVLWCCLFSRNCRGSLNVIIHAYCAGHSRNIHFPFDIEGDTAMCVASEMVAELDLSDQDVTTIAEMIDAEILALVPEWQPGVAVDDETGYTTIHDGTDPVAFSSDESVLEELSTSWKPRSTSPR